MLKVSGLGDKISSLMYSVENETYDIIIEEDGSTDLGTILFRHLLMDIPQIHQGIKMQLQHLSGSASNRNRQVRNGLMGYYWNDNNRRARRLWHSETHRGHCFVIREAGKLGLVG
jgi:hypothetical protein